MTTPGWLQEKLFERRMVLVTGRLDDALANQAAAQIMTLDATGDEPIDVVVDSGEGTLEAAFVLIDVIDAAQATVRVQCRGQVSGPAVGVVAAADERSASPHTSFRLIAPAAAASGTPDQIAAQSEHHRQLLWRFQARVARATGRAVEDIADDMRRGRHLDAQEALDHGLIDAIGSGR
jgi:ATP-dependent Clp protease protease subunit